MCKRGTLTCNGHAQTRPYVYTRPSNVTTTHKTRHTLQSAKARVGHVPHAVVDPRGGAPLIHMVHEWPPVASAVSTRLGANA